jgi:hypothetical protein
MPILIATVVSVALLGLLNLMLTLAVIRRLRVHTTQLAALTRGSPDLALLPAGTPLPALPGPDPAGLRLIAFLSTTCDVCHEQVPDLTRFLAAHGIARSAALVVVVGAVDDPAGQRLANPVDAVATVVREPSDGPVTSAFGVHLFPTFYLVDDGVVRSGAVAVSQLAEPVRA